MKRLIVGLAMLAAMLAPAFAEEFSDPKALVHGIYDDYSVGRTVADPTTYYSKRLKAIYDQAIENQVFANDAAMDGAEFTPNTVFNPFLPDANALLFDVAIGEPVVMGDRALATVSYHNFDQPRLLSIAMVKEGESWKVDDVSSMGDEEHWLLSWALTYDVFSN